MKRYNEIKKNFLFLNVKNLILLLLIFSTLLIIYFSNIKYKNLIFEQIVFYNNKVFFGSKNKIKPNLIILGYKYMDPKSLVNELYKKLNLAKNKNDLSVISNVLRKKNLIKKFIITKTSDNMLTIKIEEQKIIGLTIIKNSTFLIDDFNNLIKAKISPNLYNLPFFYGKNSNKNANVILRLIKESDINLNYMSFSLIDNRRWNINLNNGVKILLPENNVTDTLKLLKKTDSEHNILTGNFVEIDLRIFGKYFLKPKIY